MTRAVIYARYSTDLQSAASIEDQVRLCKERISAMGWTLLTTYSDRGAAAHRTCDLVIRSYCSMPALPDLTR